VRFRSAGIATRRFFRSAGRCIAWPASRAGADMSKRSFRDLGRRKLGVRYASTFRGALPRRNEFRVNSLPHRTPGAIHHRVRRQYSDHSAPKCSFSTRSSAGIRMA